MSDSKPVIPQFVDLENARVDEQRQVMQEIIDQNHCPFCMDNLRKYHKQQILKEGTYWILTPNQWPYEHTRVHLLAILKQHAEKLSEIPPEAGKELFEMIAWAEKEFNVAGGGVAMRFGDTNYSAGTVNHIHAQFIVPDLDNPNFQPVRVKIGKGG